jgi:hypothetical protein
MKSPVFHPQAHSPFEIGAMRLLFALVVWDVLPWTLPAQELSMPVGLAGMGLDLGFLANPAMTAAVNWVALAVLIVYVAGWAPWLTTSILLVLTVLTGTFINSNGSIKHHHQIVSLILLAQAVWHIWYAVRHRAHPDKVVRERWAVFASQQAIVAAYVVTGLTKLLTAGPAWPVSGARYFVVQVRKTNQQAYYDRLEPGRGFVRGVEGFLLDHPTFTACALGFGLLLELMAWLALLGRRWGFAYGLLLIVFHFTNSVVMDLNFRWHSEVLGIFFILPPLLAALKNWSEGHTREVRHAAESVGRKRKKPAARA